MSKAKLNRLFALALVLVMTLSMAVPAMAATGADGKQVPPYTINIVPNDYTAVPPDDASEGRFNAYQIFAGEINEKPAADGGYNGTVGDSTDGNGYQNPNANQLSHVTWGNGVDGSKIGELLYALTQDATVNAGNKLSSALTAAGYKVNGTGNAYELDTANSVGNEDSALADTAAIVAKAISTASANNAAMARAFAEVVSKYLSSTSTPSTWSEGQWHIGNLAAGYYLIDDTHTNLAGEENKAKSDYLVGVFGDSTIYVKSDVPEVDKEIVGATPPEGDSAEIGKTLTFRLSGTLPENFGTYDKYFYQFNDTLSAGLTYDGGGSNISGVSAYKDVLRVYVKIGSEYYLIDLDPMNGGDGQNEATGAGYQLSVSDGGDNKTKLTVTFDDLKKLKGRKVTDTTSWAASDSAEAITLTAGSEIYVDYTAHLNKGALINAANPNEVSLKYSNDPTWDGTGTEPKGDTPEEYVYVYDFGIKLYKYDTIKGAENGKLPGAGFALSKTVSEDGANVKYYAVFAKEGTEYVLAGWVKEAELTTLDTNSDGKWDIVDWKAAATTGDGISGTKLADNLNEAYKEATDNTYYLAIVTDDDGNLKFKGLEDDITYSLSEVIAPEGYEKLPGDITVKYTAEYYDEESVQSQINALKAQLEGLTEEENHEEIAQINQQIAELETVLGTAKQNQGKLKNLTATVVDADGSETSQQIVKDGAWGNLGTGSYSEYAAQLDVPNTPSGYLPGTGGVGVYLFYIGGGLLLAFGVAFLFLTGRKKNVQ